MSPLRQDASLAPDAAFPDEEQRIARLSQQEFREFYEHTFAPLRAYLSRMSGDATLADDLAQEAYVRTLQADLAAVDGAGRKRYLFRIATNLLHDHRRRVRVRNLLWPARSSPPDAGRQAELRTDVARVFKQLKARERQLLWLAYVEGFSHAEIAEVTGLTADSVRPLLFRARQAFARLLRKHGLAAPESS